MLPLLLALLASPATGQAARAEAPPAQTTCVPGDPCCPPKTGDWCRVGCPPPVPTPTFQPPPDVTTLTAPPPTGVAILEIAIDERGRVISACVLRSLRPDADRAALRSTWTPKQVNGRPVGVIATVTYKFPPPAWTRPLVTPRAKLPITKGPVVFVDPAMRCPAGKKGPTRAGSVIATPPLLHFVEPAAPSAGVTGTAIVEVVIDGDGAVSRATPLRGDSALTAPAATAIARWRYARACLDGTPIPLIIVVSLTYG